MSQTGRHDSGAKKRSGAVATGAAAVGAAATGALAFGAVAMGALAVGSLAVGALAVKRARLRALTVDELTIGRVRIRDLSIGGERSAADVAAARDPQRTGPAAAGDRSDLQKSLLSIEHRLWTNDASYYEHALVNDALLVFRETGVITRDEAVAAIRRENADGRRWADVAFDDVVCRPVDGEAALLTYRVRARWAGDSATMHALASSLYLRRGRAWKLAFHQQTAVDPG